jgi:hypothetical protein
LYSGYLSSHDDYETDLEEDEEAATTTPKVESPQLEKRRTRYARGAGGAALVLCDET